MDFAHMMSRHVQLTRDQVRLVAIAMLSTVVQVIAGLVLENGNISIKWAMLYILFGLLMNVAYYKTFML